MRGDKDAMNNHKIIPCERNRYFYGKLLTVRDFEIEQRYFNDKRRLINRLFVGPGILAGLNVLMVDDKTILVEPGVALDYLGREIVVDKPYISRLSVIDGFESVTEQSEVYLSLTYGEENREAVHNVSATGQDQTSQSEFNRIAESYKLNLSGTAPSTAHQLEELIARSQYQLMDTPEVMVSLIMPSSASLSEGYRVQLDIQKKKSLAPITMEVCLSSRYINFGQDMLLKFDERTLTMQSSYRMEWQFDISPVEAQDDLISVKGFKLEAEPLSKNSLDFPVEHATTLSALPWKDMIEEKYRQLSLDELMSASADDVICLAKLRVLKTDKTYVIESVQSDPFNQLIANLQLTKLLSEHKLRQMGGTTTDSTPQPVMPISPAASSGDVSVNTGKITFEFKRKVNPKEKYFSVETPHDLGPGDIFIDLAVDSETRDGDASFGYQNQLVYGDFEIFEKSNYEPVVPMMKTASVCYKNKGSFVVGIQFLEPYNKDELVIRWKATKVHPHYDPLHKVSSLIIEPAMAKMKTREQMSFNVFYENEPLSCIWKIKEPNGGEIDQSGVYLSPSIEGVYEIIAEIPERHESLSAYVVVENE